MPKLRFTYRVVGEAETFTEEDVYGHLPDITIPGKQQVMVWNEKADKHGEPERELVKSEITDPFIHQHEWVVVISHKFTGSDEYVRCGHCEVTGKRIKTGDVTRDPKFHSDHYEYCRERLPKPRNPTFK